MRRSLASSSPGTWTLAAVLGLAVSRVAVAQTATDVGTEQQNLAQVIPNDCLAVCTPWRSTLVTCPADTDATYSNCVCDATFISNFQQCTSCMQPILTQQGDTADATTAQQAPVDLQSYCGQAGVVVTSATSTTTTDALTTSSTTTSDLLTTTTPTTTSLTSTDSTFASSGSALNQGAGSLFTATTPSLTYSTVTSSTSLPSTVTQSETTEFGLGQQAPKTVTQAGADQPFPTQSKDTNKFASGAGPVARGGYAAVVLAVVAGGWLLA